MTLATHASLCAQDAFGVTDIPLTPEAAEARMRALLTEYDLPQPDEIEPRADGGITCLWYEQKVAVIVTADDAADELS